METKEIKIQVPEGYEIDKENSTFECIKFKSIRNDITYAEICDKIFNNNIYSTNSYGHINCNRIGVDRFDLNNATNENKNGEYFHIVFHPSINYTIYCRKEYFLKYGVLPFFNRKEDAQAVIDNPNFREILDTIYKL